MKRTPLADGEPSPRPTESPPGSRLRMRRVYDGDVTSRLGAAKSALQGPPWNAPPRRSVAEALRTSILELAELEDAAASARDMIADRHELTETLGYVGRVGAFLRRAADGVMFATFEAADVHEALSDAIELWEPQVPWDVVFEIADRADADLHGRIFEVSAAWDRAARGLVRRHLIGFGPA